MLVYHSTTIFFKVRVEEYSLWHLFFSRFPYTSKEKALTVFV